MKSNKLSIVIPVITVSVLLAGGCRSTAILKMQKRIDAHVTFKLEEGTTINAWVIRPKIDEGPTGKMPATALLLHPLLHSQSFFFSRGEKLAQQGWYVVLPDLRDHGESKARGVTWGAMERKDLSYLMDRLINEGLASDRVFVLGGSYGGCVALLYATYDTRCEGVLAISPPDGLRGVKEISYRTRPEDYIRQKVMDEAFRFGYSPTDASPSHHAAFARVPLVMVQPKRDLLVPKEQVMKIYSAWKGPKAMEKLSAGHTDSMLGRDEWYAGQMKRLLEMSDQNQPSPLLRTR